MNITTHPRPSQTPVDRSAPREATLLQPREVARLPLYTAEEEPAAGGTAYRLDRSLAWTEHPDVASLGARVDVINRAVRLLTNTSVDRSRPVTLISLGSGNLLTEELLDRQLERNGFASRRWRLIDPAYAKNINQNDEAYQTVLAARKQFLRNRPTASVYSTEQTYLRKIKDAHRIAGTDKASGTTLLLAVDPPTMLPESRAHTAAEDRPISTCLVSDVQQANCVYLLFAAKDEQSTELFDALEKSVREHQVNYPFYLRLDLVESGELRIVGGNHRVSTELRNVVLNRAVNADRRPRIFTSMGELSEFASSTARAFSLSAASANAARAVLANDIALAEARLRAFFADAPHCVHLVALKSNRVTNENVARPGPPAVVQ